ncbi:hypothetical protein [Frondihabitans australicus]|uniref:Uncharacterized protein n=1 Tax=Frondihabitans australicus TaxID=386892 RepID=A0A495IAH6_9MICO|nr:hypothetical protein [Frondihabitans australicus]RKR73007.1 hypothetical protein C8E83_0089 [Frondihabitans australicus]
MTDNSKNDAGAATSADERAAMVRSTRRWDLRRLLGGLFAFYGIICVILGIVHSSSDLHKTGGIAINLWAGIGMIVAAIAFLVWDRLAPVPEEDIVGSLEAQDHEKAVGEGRAAG